jgi:predicted ribosomally synthesized peptide with SipW-like signal peptide
MINKKILLSLLFIGVVAAAAGSGTWAQFSDEEISADNTFMAGELDLLVSVSDETGLLSPISGNLDGSALIDVEDVSPVDSGLITIVLENAGTMPGEIGFLFAYEDDGGVLTEPEEEAGDDSTDTGDLSSCVYLTISEVTATGTEELYTGYLADLGGADPLDDETLFAGTTNARTFTVAYEVIVPEGTDENIIQGDSVDFDMTFTLTQSTSSEAVA